MKNIDNKAVTALVRSMRKALAEQHGVRVAHSALRASYLQALGQNPHAFAKKAEAVAPLVTAAVSFVTKTLYLVEDDSGCLGDFSMDPEGLFILDLDDDSTSELLADARLVQLKARVPSIRRYGLPDYLSSPVEFFGNRGLSLSADRYAPEIEDSQDDSGDTVSLTVRVAAGTWDHLLLRAIQQNAHRRDDVSEWVGLHHRKVFETLSLSEKASMMERYLETLCVDEGEEEPAVTFEWVYPDEDSDSLPATVDAKTGEITVTGEVPDIVYNSEVRVRIVFDDEPYEAVFPRRNPSGKWKLEAAELRAFNEAYAE